MSRSRSPSPIPFTSSTIIDPVIEIPHSGLSSRSERLLPTNLTSNCEENQLLGNIGELPPDNCFESESDGDDGEEKKTTFERVYPTRAGAGASNWGLFFDSNFECGNLAYADIVHRHTSPGQPPSIDEYNLYLTQDNNGQAKGNAFWFFFKIQNMKKGKPYRLNICNFTRSR